MIFTPTKYGSLNCTKFLFDWRFITSYIDHCTTPLHQPRQGMIPLFSFENSSGDEVVRQIQPSPCWREIKLYTKQHISL